MSEPKSIVDAQVKHLLKIVDRNRAESCAAIQARASEQASVVIKRAHRQARRKMHEQNARTRENLRRQVISTEARLQTRMRLIRQQNDKALLDAGWAPLKKALTGYWQDAGTRKQWIENLVSLAREKFVSMEWIFEHSPGWDEQEKKELQATVVDITGHTPGFRADDGISAGLRVCATGACIDATVEGLLRNSTRIESLMLTAIHEQGKTDND
jgi:hypothetical protein